MLPLIATMMVIFMIMVAFSIDIAHMHLAKMELLLHRMRLRKLQRKS